MADYTINFTDPAKTPFVIKPLTTNGPASPASAVPLDSQAVSANTSVVLLGQGMNAYGERVAETIVHILENFANATAPAFPIQGQLWYNNVANTLSVYTGAVWIALGTAVVTSDLDMLGFKIVNLGNPTNPGDALNLGFADSRYVNITGDTMTGLLTISAGPTSLSTTGNIVLTGLTSQITLPNAPLIGTDGANKAYVDAAVVGGGIGTFVQIIGDTMTGPLVVNSTITTSNTISITTGNLQLSNGTILTNGDIVLSDLTYTITGVLTGAAGYWDIAGNVAARFPTGKTFSVLGNAGGALVNVNYQVVSAVHVGPDTRLSVVFINGAATVSGTVTRPGIVTIPSKPNDDFDAANKAYVDQEIASVGGGGAPLLLTGGSMNPGANITMTVGGEVLGLPALPSGPTAAVSFQYVNNIYTLNPPPLSPSYLRDNAGLAVSVPPALPNTYSVQAVVDALDFGLGVVGGVQFEREVFRGDGTTTQFTLPFTYLTESDKLEVFVNGIQQYRAFRGKSYVKMNPTTSYDKFASGGDATGLPANTYDFNIDVDGAGVVNVPVVVPANSTFNSLLDLINAALTAAGVLANCALLNGTYKFYSYKQDVPTFTASVYITPGTTDLFAAITGPAAPLTTPQRTIVGANITSNYFEVVGDFTDPSSATFQIDAPFYVNGSTGNNGLYVIAGLAYDYSTSRTRIYTTSGSLRPAQTEANYNGLGGNGTFVGGDGPGGTSYAIGEVITLSNSATITVATIDVNGDVATFSVTTGGSSVLAGTTLTQTSTTGSGTGFTLTPQAPNLAIANAVAGGFITMFEFFTSITDYPEPSPVTLGTGVNIYREAGELLALGASGTANTSLRYFDVSGSPAITANLLVGSKIEIIGGANAGIYTIRGFNYNVTVAGRTVIFVNEAIPSAVTNTNTNINYFTPALIDCNMITFDVGTIPPANSIIEVRLTR